MQHGALRPRVERPGGHQHPVADGADGLAGGEGIDRHLLDLEALEVVAHPSGPVPARQHQRVVPAPPGRAPRQRGSKAASD